MPHLNPKPFDCQLGFLQQKPKLNKSAKNKKAHFYGLFFKKGGAVK